MNIEGLQPDKLLEVIQIQTQIAKLGLDLGSIIALVAERSPHLTGADGAVVELAEGDEMVYRASSGTAQKQLGLRLKREGSLSGLCVAEGKPLRCDDSENDPRVDREACRRVGLRSMIVTPLMHGETAVGVLKVLSKEPLKFGDVEARTLDLMSELIAAAMYHAARFETSELLRLATHDPLTGLANRALFYDRLRGQLALSRRQSDKFAVLNLDMDGLKPINDLYGHRAGDAAIQAVADRVKSQARDTDTVARMGGDEFALLLSGVQDGSQLETVTQRISQSIAEPFAFEDRTLRLGASIGSAVFPDDGTEPESLIESADQAMYRVKRERHKSMPPR